MIKGAHGGVMGKIFKFYNLLGNSKKEKFTRFLILVSVILISLMMIINVGYDKTKGGCYWKPADISIKKGVDGGMK